MHRSTLLVFAAVLTGSAQLQAQGLLDSIRTPDKAVSTITQTMEGTWMTELRPAGLPEAAPAIPNLATFHPDGTMTASASDGTQTSAHGAWIRVGDRKFLATIFLFSFNEARVLTTITKARINLQISLDGQTITGTNEVVIMDRNGTVKATIRGGTTSGVRLSPERPDDFCEFQERQ